MQQSSRTARSKARQSDADSGEAFAERQIDLSDIEENDHPFFSPPLESTQSPRDQSFPDIFDFENFDLEGTGFPHQPDFASQAYTETWPNQPAPSSTAETSMNHNFTLGYDPSQQTFPMQATLPHRTAEALSYSTLEAAQLPPPSTQENLPSPRAPGSKVYKPYSAKFSSSEEAKQCRRAKMRFERQPYIKDDPSIAEIEANRQLHVKRIYDAMVRGDIARDNLTSHARKRWVCSAEYTEELIEAYAHKVLDVLIEQVKYGFRGWGHHDYVDDGRKYVDADRDIDCAGRLDNIISALENEKTVCEDVMEASKNIRVLINAPIAYANRKYQNRLGNAKRRSATQKDENDAAETPAKIRRTRGGRGRARAATFSGSSLRATTLQQAHEASVSPTAPDSSSPYGRYESLPNQHPVSQSMPDSSFIAAAQTNNGSAMGHTMGGISMLAQAAQQAPLASMTASRPNVGSLPSEGQSQYLPATFSDHPSHSPLSPGAFDLSFAETTFGVGSWQPFSTSVGSSSTNIQQVGPPGAHVLHPDPSWGSGFQPLSHQANPGNTNFLAQIAETGVSLAEIEDPSFSSAGGQTDLGNQNQTLPSQHSNANQHPGPYWHHGSNQFHY